MSRIARAYDRSFRMSEQQISNDIVKLKAKLGVNAYWGRVKSGGEFPMHSGLDIKKIRLSRIGFGTLSTGWRKMVDSVASSNFCSQPDRERVTHGSDDYTYSLETFGIRTDDICLALLPYRQMPEAEIAHMEEGIKTLAQFFWNEYLRTRYIHNCDNKVVATVDQTNLSGDTCDLLKTECFPNIETTDGFMFWHRTDSGPSITATTSPLDERYVSVAVDKNNIGSISELTLDLIEVAAIQLEFEDENRPMLDMGVPFIDVVVPDAKMSRRMAQIERMQEQECSNAVMWDGKNLTRALGVRRVFRDNYSLRYDAHGLKFYPDDAYNNAISEPFDATAPETWPRFVRVLAYIPRRNLNGTVGYVVNPDFLRAPFGISTIFTPTVMKMRSIPDPASVGSAKIGDTAREHNGSAKWINEHHETKNPRRETGHWELDFGASIEPDRPEFGFAFFSRLDHRITLAANPCGIRKLPTQPGDMTNFSYATVESGETIEVGDFGANTHDTLSSYESAYIL